MRLLAGVMLQHLLRSRTTGKVSLQPMVAISVFQPKVFTQANMQ